MRTETKHSMHSFEMHNLALDYLRAAKIVVLDDRPPQLPLASMYVHSLELAFKCFLTLQGKSKNYLRNKIGHDIIKAMEASKDLGLSVSPDLEEAVSWLSPLHKERTFHYFERSVIHLPDARTCSSIIQRLLDELTERVDLERGKALRGEPYV